MLRVLLPQPLHLLLRQFSGAVLSSRDEPLQFHTLAGQSGGLQCPRQLANLSASGIGLQELEEDFSLFLCPWASPMRLRFVILHEKLQTLLFDWQEMGNRSAPALWESRLPLNWRQGGGKILRNRFFSLLDGSLLITFGVFTKKEFLPKRKTPSDEVKELSRC
jgi:hypothetical protein